MARCEMSRRMGGFVKVEKEKKALFVAAGTSIGWVRGAQARDWVQRVDRRRHMWACAGGGRAGPFINALTYGWGDTCDAGHGMPWWKAFDGDEHARRGGAGAEANRRDSRDEEGLMRIT